MTDLGIDPLIPGALWLVLAAGGACLLAWYARRRPRATGPFRWTIAVTLMSLSLAMVLGLLLNPTWTRELPRPAGKPVLVALIDSSESMSTPDAPGGATRFSAAAKIVSDMADRLGGQFDVRIRSFDATVRAAGAAPSPDAKPDGIATDLTAAIDACLAEDHPQGQAIVLISDGIDNASGGTGQILDAARAADALATPIYTATIGGAVARAGTAVDVRTAQDLAVIDQKVPLVARVTNQGLTSTTVDVTLWHDNRQIGDREVHLQPGVESDAIFLLSQHEVGVYPYEVRVDPPPGQTAGPNNSASYVLHVVSEPIHVLLLEGKPYWDSKFFTRTLMSDPAIALDCIVRLTDGRLLHRTLSHQTAATKPATAPADESDFTSVETWKIEVDAAKALASPDQLRDYQIVVIGRDAEPFLDATAVANLQDWVSQQGGALLCYRGSPTSTQIPALAKLLPVSWEHGNAERYRVVLTPEGRDLNWFSQAAGAGDSLAGLPSLSANEAIGSQKPLAVRLAQGTGASPPPVVITQMYGAGRAVVVEGAGMWRWAFLAPQFQDQDAIYSTLWHSMLHWMASGQQLTPGQTFSLRSDKVRFDTGESATATLLARQDVASDPLRRIQLSADGSNQTTQFAPVAMGTQAGVFRVDFGKLPPGRYHAQLAGVASSSPADAIVFDVRTYDVEMLDLQARPDLMARIAAESHGAALAADPVGQVSEQFSRHLAALLPPRYLRTSAWDRWWILFVVIAFMTISWVVRRSGGLV